MPTTLRYTGDEPTNFAGYRSGQVDPGDEFAVPNDIAQGYSRRADFEVVSTEPDETDPPETSEEPQEDPGDTQPTEDPDPAPEEPQAAPQPAPEPEEAEPAPAEPAAE